MVLIFLRALLTIYACMPFNSSHSILILEFRIQFVALLKIFACFETLPSICLFKILFLESKIQLGALTKICACLSPTPPSKILILEFYILTICSEENVCVTQISCAVSPPAPPLASLPPLTHANSFKRRNSAEKSYLRIWIMFAYFKGTI